MTLRRMTAFLVLLLFAGCTFFRRPERHFYSLEVIPPQTTAAAITGLPIGIDALELPPQTVRREIAVRQSDGQLDVRGTELWAGPIEPMILHTLAFDLARRLPEGMVVLPGQVRPVGAMRSLNLVFEEFGAGPANVVVVDVRWTLRTAPATAAPVHHERIEVPVDSLQSGQVAAGISRALAALADRIVSTLAA